MLKFNVEKMLALRGIDRPFTFLLKIGFTRAIAHNLITYEVYNIKIAHLEKLCRALNCTPNDLFDWNADDQKPLGESHSLNSLVRSDKPVPQLAQIVRDIPVDKLDKIADLLNQLKNDI